MSNFYFEYIGSFIKNHYIIIYIIFFLSALLQMLIPPHPGDLFLIYQGYLSEFHGYSFMMLFLTCCLGTYCGSLITYRFGYINGDAVFKYKLIKRFFTRRQHITAKKMFRKFGSLTIFIGKFLLGINVVSILFAGIFKIKLKNIHTSLIASILVHHIIFMLLGKFLANNIANIKSLIATYNELAFIATVLIMIIIIILVYLKNKKNNY